MWENEFEVIEMMQAIEGIYQNGHIKLLEIPKAIRRSRVVVTFLEDNGKPAEDRVSVVGSGKILVDDLEEASLEIPQIFLDAIEKSGGEVAG